MLVRRFTVGVTLGAMAEHRKYMRFFAEFEIEVTDPTAAAAYTMDWTNTPSGPAMVPYETVEEQMQAALQQAIFSSLGEVGPGAGFKYLSGSVLPRFLNEAGDRYLEWPLAPLPARRDDGTLAADWQ